MPRLPRRRRILVVDDHPDIRRLIRDILTPMGYEVEGVASGRTALRRLREDRCTALLTDYRMPGMTGAELIDRAEGEGRRLPKLLMTGVVDDDLEAWLRAHRDVRLLSKPFGPGDLARALSRLRMKK